MQQQNMKAPPLLLYAFVMLPLFIQMMVLLFGNENWWPLKKRFT